MSPGVLLLWGLGFGAALGIIYDFLHPVQRRCNWPADGIFVICMFSGWVWYSFGFCGGGIRMATTGAFFLGMGLWELTLARLTKRLFGWFWQGIFQVLGFVTGPVRKIFKEIGKIVKKVFAYWKKRGTIEENRRSMRRQKTGGSDHEKEKKSLFQSKDRIQPR